MYVCMYVYDTYIRIYTYMYNYKHVYVSHTRK
jgi:hypothetical protein